MNNRTRFSKEFKLKVIDLSEKSYNINDVAISLGINEALLYRWIKEYFKREGKGDVFPGVGKSVGILDPEREELKCLRKENKDLKEERDILKKAVSIVFQERSMNGHTLL
jgi:transposase